MENITISVVVPIYNVENWLENTILSIITQDYDNVEVILVNDESTDNSSNIINKYAAQDHRIKVVEKSNGGLASSRNEGLKHATGQYILFVDGDDELSENMLSKLVEIVDAANPDVIMFPHVNVYETQEILIPLFSNPKKIWYRNQWKQVYRKLIGPINEEVANVRHLDQMSTAWGKLYKRDIIRAEFKGYEENYPEDLFFNIQNLRDVSNVVYTESAIYRYNKRDVNTVTRKFSRTNFDSSGLLMNLIDGFIKDLGEEEKLAAENRKYLRLLSFMLLVGSSTETLASKYQNYRYILENERSKFNYEIAKKQILYMSVPYRVIFAAIIKRKVVAVLIIFEGINLLRRLGFGK